MDSRNGGDNMGQSGPPGPDSTQPTGWSEPAAEHMDDYLRLDTHVEHLKAERRPPSPERLTPDQARAYQAAALFHAAAPGAADPTPEFAAQLRARLEREVPKQTSRMPRRLPILSRRGLLTAGASAAAALAAGVAGGVALERTTLDVSPPPRAWSGPLVEQGAWVAVVAADAVPVGGVHRFVTEQVAGFVRHTTSGFTALSGACTHMGCLLAWNGTARTYDCPCHGGRFLETGETAPSSPVSYRPLPPIQTKVAAGQVWVFLPTSGAAAAEASATPGARPYPTGQPDQ